MSCRCCPVSPLAFLRKPAAIDGEGGGENLDQVDDEVREADADTTRPAIGKKPDASPLVRPLPSPKPMTEAEWEEHCANGHLPYDEGCP